MIYRYLIKKIFVGIHLLVMYDRGLYANDEFTSIISLSIRVLLPNFKETEACNSGCVEMGDTCTPGLGHCCRGAYCANTPEPVCLYPIPYDGTKPSLQLPAQLIGCIFRSIVLNTFFTIVQENWAFSSILT